MISNEGAKPGVCPMLQLLSLVLLQVHIGQAAPHMEVSNIGWQPYQSSKWEQPTALGGAGCRCSWRHEQRPEQIALSARSLKPHSALPFC